MIVISFLLFYILVLGNIISFYFTKLFPPFILLLFIFEMIEISSSMQKFIIVSFFLLTFRTRHNYTFVRDLQFVSSFLIFVTNNFYYNGYNKYFKLTHSTVFVFVYNNIVTFIDCNTYTDWHCTGYLTSNGTAICDIIRR